MRRRWQMALAALGSVVMLASAGCRSERDGTPPARGESPPQAAPQQTGGSGEGGQAPSPESQSDEATQGQGTPEPGFQGGAWRGEGTHPEGN